MAPGPYDHEIGRLALLDQVAGRGSHGNHHFDRARVRRANRFFYSFMKLPRGFVLKLGLIEEDGRLFHPDDDRVAPRKHGPNLRSAKFALGHRPSHGVF